MVDIFMKVCVFFFKKLANVNYKYDKLQEPKRFYVAMGVGILPFITLDAFALIVENRGLNILAMLWILLVVGIRIWWLHGDLKDWKVDN